MSANGQPTVEAVTAIIRRGELVAVIDRRSRYGDNRKPITLDPAWKVTVVPSGGRPDLSGHRDTFEGAQALAVQLLEWVEKHAETVKAEHHAYSALVALANARPAQATRPAVTDEPDPDGEPPF
jgi:hypothetical protein